MKRIKLLLNCLLIFYLTRVNYCEIYDEDIIIAVPEVIPKHSPLNEPAPESYVKVNNCTCRINPGIYVTCYGLKCRSFPSELVIHVPLLKFKLSSVTVIKIGDFKLFSKLKFLEIESNTVLETLEPGCFQNLHKIQNLTLAFNPKLKYLAENVFGGLINLKSLYLQSNGFKTVLDTTVALSVKYLPNLCLLALNGNPFKYIGAKEFFPMNGTHLRELNLIFCGLEYIHSDCLIPLTNMSSLRLGENNLNSSVIAKLVERSVRLNIPLMNLNLYGMRVRTNIPKDLLQAVAKSKIRFLHIPVNHFDQLHTDSFPLMPNLLQLSLRSCHISEIEPNTFRGLINLEALLLSSNRLQYVPEAILLPTLLDLDLSGNTHSHYESNYFYIENNIFQNMTNLRNLHLSYNNIGMLTKYSFMGLTNLEKLNLKNTTLHQIEPGSFAPLKNLILLNFINNPFPKQFSLTADIFEGLSNLQILLLSGCSIKNLTISPSIFTFTPKLRYLNLEKNDLFVINFQHFASLPKLEYLNLDENNIAAWKKRLIPNNNSLRHFKAGQNKISFITAQMVEDWKNVEILQLEGNPISCDCSLFPVVNWMQKTADLKWHVFANDNAIASCVSPSSWRGRKIEEYLINEMMYPNSDCQEPLTSIPALQIILIVLLVIFLFIIIIVILFYTNRWRIEAWLFHLRLKSELKTRPGKQLFSASRGNFMYDVFISYCTADEVFAKALVSRLESYGVVVCYYERDFPIGVSIPAAAAFVVAASKRTLLLVSNAFAKSHWCRWETQLAEYQQLFFGEGKIDGLSDVLIIVKLEEIEKKLVTSTLKYLMKTRIYLEWSEHPIKEKIFWEKLLSTIVPPPSSKIPMILNSTN